MKQIAKGIYKLTFGTPEEHTPDAYREDRVRREQIRELPISRVRSWQEEQISWKKTKRGITITLPMDTTEDIYGFGLQLQSVNHAGRRRYIKVNSDPVADTGEGHAPVPFYISTAGYGLFVDTFRYATFYMGTNTDRGVSSALTAENEPHTEFSESALYALKRAKEERRIIIDIPAVEGVEVLLFEGNVTEVVQRYNLYSGGGCLPPMWGLGMWYRSYGGSDEAKVMEQAESFRQEQLPVDVLGIEPGWHSHSYSCTYKWSNLFPTPEHMTKTLRQMGYRMNLWEHAFVYPRASFYKELLPYSGDYEVWNGLVPDLATQEAVQLFSDYHKEQFVKKGISGFKLDECDNSDYNPSNWSYPDATEFPSGMDGEQMHMAIGVLYQRMIQGIYQEENQRTYSEVRSSGAFAAPLPFVLYSDLYDHKQFIRGVVNSGFSGLLWCPEVRDCVNGDDLLRRLQTVVFSSQALINSWRVTNPLWKQTDITKNLAGEEMDTAEYYTKETRKLFELRMQLLPYLYSAFEEYRTKGMPPIRALVMDYPEEEAVRQIDDQYMFGASMMVCPLTYEDGKERKIYFPKGNWYQFSTGKKIVGGDTYTVCASYTEIPVYVREGSMIPLADPVQCVKSDTIFHIHAQIYGNMATQFTLYEDDFETCSYEQKRNTVELNYVPGKAPQLVRTGQADHRYELTGYKVYIA